MTDRPLRHPHANFHLNIQDFNQKFYPGANGIQQNQVSPLVFVLSQEVAQPLLRPLLVCKLLPTRDDFSLLAFAFGPDEVFATGLADGRQCRYLRVEGAVTVEADLATNLRVERCHESTKVPDDKPDCIRLARNVSNSA